MYCGKCGAERIEGNAFCTECGHRFDTAEAAGQRVAPTETTAGVDEPYPSWATLAAIITAIFMPLISLIAALLMRSGEKSERRRGFLKNWAIGSAAWLGTGWAIGLIAFVAVSGAGGSGGGCQGGPDPFNPDVSYVSSDNVHWTAIVPCRDGGHMSRPAKPGEVPG